MPLNEIKAMQMLEIEGCPFTREDFERSKKDNSIPLCICCGEKIYLSVKLKSYAKQPN